MARTCLTLILAAGEGTRMRSDLPKVLHPVAGLPMISHVIRASVGAASDAIGVVVGNSSDDVAEIATGESNSVEIHIQDKRLGTAHAVMSAKGALDRGYDDVLVLFGDAPLLRHETLTRMRDTLAAGANVAVLGFRTDRPDGYGRMVEEGGKLVRIREHFEASEEERRINLCNGGIMAIDGANALELVNSITNDNAKGEYYLTDIVEIAGNRGLEVIAMEASASELLGVNNQVELSEAEHIWQQRAREQAMLEGVSMSAPHTVFLHHDTELAQGVSIEPNAVFGAGVRVSAGAQIRAFSYLEGAEIGENTVVGPYARIRPGTVMEKGSKAGNFVEVKNAHVREGAKINHLSYVGDGDIGRNANIGAGTIFCNYDGTNKHKTVIGEGAFVGSNSSLIAPVTIGDGAYVASGSTVTDDVPDDAMGVARGRQVNKEGYAKAIRKRSQAEKGK